MNYSNPNAQSVGLSPITYFLEEYEPAGMDGIFIVEANLDVEIDDLSNEPYISDITFPAERGPNSNIPAAFKTVLLKVMNADAKLLDSIGEDCATQYEKDRW
jgi:hypothetical protein